MGLKQLMGLNAPSGSKAAGASPLGDSLRSLRSPPLNLATLVICHRLSAPSGMMPRL